MTRIRLAKPAVGREELERIEQVLASGYLTQGEVVAQFEREVASSVGTKHAFATSSATTALHLSLVAVGVKPGDEVVVPAFTFPATANVVVQTGATPVFADIDPGSFAVTAGTLESAVTSRTVAVMPVDPFGHPAPMPDICSFAADRGLRVVEDAACAIGAQVDGSACGSFPDVGCFSFHPRKVITTGEGGMITTNDDDLAEAISVLRNHGGVRQGGRFEFQHAGFNYRLSDVAGAIGLAQMGKLPALLEARADRSALLSELLSGLSGVRVPQAEAGYRSTFQSYVVMLDPGIDRDRVIGALDSLGVEATIGTYGLHLEPYFRQTYGTTPEAYPHATLAARQSLALPMYPEMTEQDVQRVAVSLEAALTGSVAPVH